MCSSREDKAIASAKDGSWVPGVYGAEACRSVGRDARRQASRASKQATRQEKKSCCGMDCRLFGLGGADGQVQADRSK